MYVSLSLLARILHNKLTPIETSSRYFITQSGKELKWRVGSHRMEVRDSSNINLA